MATNTPNYPTKKRKHGGLQAQIDLAASMAPPMSGGAAKAQPTTAVASPKVGDDSSAPTTTPETSFEAAIAGMTRFRDEQQKKIEGLEKLVAAEKRSTVFWNSKSVTADQLRHKAWKENAQLERQAKADKDKVQALQIEGVKVAAAMGRHTKIVDVARKLASLSGHVGWERWLKTLEELKKAIADEDAHEASQAQVEGNEG